MPTIINTVLSESRGKPRVWLEGEKLRREGVEIGSRYNAEFTDNGVILRLGNEGKYTVSRRKARTSTQVDKPLIEFKDERLQTLFINTPELRVTVLSNRITISARSSYERSQDRFERLKSKLDKGKPLDVVSLFHGGGVLDAAVHEGLKKQGIDSRIAVCVEMEGAYLDSSLRNNSHLFDDESVVIQSMLEKVDFDKKSAHFDCLYAGLPCVDHSVSGKAKKRDTLQGVAERGVSGAMFHYLLRIVEKVNASVLVIECVQPFANSASAAILRTVLEDMGYTLQERVFEGADYALEARKRWVMVAIDSKALSEIHFELESVKPTEAKPKNFGAVMETLPNDHAAWKTYDYLVKKEIRDKEAGKGFMRQYASEASETVPCITRQYNKVRSTDVQVKHPEDPTLTRLLTVGEHAHCKGINEALVKGNAVTTAHEILGQSVIWEVFSSIGFYLGESFRKHLCFFDQKAVA